MGSTERARGASVAQWPVLAGPLARRVGVAFVNPQVLLNLAAQLRGHHHTRITMRGEPLARARHQAIGVSSLVIVALSLEDNCHNFMLSLWLLASRAIDGDHVGGAPGGIAGIASTGCCVVLHDFHLPCLDVHYHIRLTADALDCGSEAGMLCVQTKAALDDTQRLQQLVSFDTWKLTARLLEGANDRRLGGAHD
eukprot:7377984-Prymnesium_polylepis.1